MSDGGLDDAVRAVHADAAKLSAARADADKANTEVSVAFVGRANAAGIPLGEYKVQVGWLDQTEFVKGRFGWRSKRTFQVPTYETRRAWEIRPPAFGAERHSVDHPGLYVFGDGSVIEGWIGRRDSHRPVPARAFVQELAQFLATHDA